jgi:serine phosphatase RsbU (regulator of sigma subunit)
MEIWGGNQGIEDAISTPGIDAWVYSRPYDGEHAGGDIHYVSMCNAGYVARFAVTDISGHGGVVAETARTLRALMRRNINTPDNSRFARALNEAFQMERSGGRFATAILASYFAPTDELILVNAGHPRPLHYAAAEGLWRLLGPEGGGEPESNLPIGIIDPTEFVQFAVRLGRGDLVVLYTDGLIEAKGPDGEMLGESGLLRVIASLDPARPDALRASLLEAIVARQGGAAIGDDVTVVVLHHNASDPPRYSLGEQITALAKTIGLLKV